MNNQSHNSVITVYFDRLQANLNTIKKRIGDAQVMSVIKDNAYGHGLIPVAKFLNDKTDWFCVSEVEEAVDLRKNGITKPILVFEVPRFSTLDLYTEYYITATVSDLETIPNLLSGTEFQLMFDTGMRRLGLLPNMVGEIKEQVQSRHDVQCTGIYTHFANAEVIDHTNVIEQLNLFKSIRSEFPEEWLAHTANSGAIFNFEEDYVFDAVRAGVALFGYSPSEHKFDGINPILDWKTWITQVRPIKKGDHVGYSSGWIADQDGIIATLPVGYADGIPRLVKNSIKFLKDGKTFQQVSNVTMDYLMIFSPDNDLKVGDEITLLGLDKGDAYYWAEVCGTIPYEITTQLSPSVHRNCI